MRYLSSRDALFSFDGWKPEETPTACFDRKDYMACLHGCMLAITLIGDFKLSHVAISDDGILHELVHLASEVDLCTCNTLEELRDIVVTLETRTEEIYDRHQCSSQADEESLPWSTTEHRSSSVEGE